MVITCNCNLKMCLLLYVWNFHGLRCDLRQKRNFPNKCEIWVLVIKLNRCTNFQIYFWKKLKLFRTVPLSIIRSFSLYTQQWYMAYMSADSLQAVSKPVCIAVRTVKNSWWWTEELSETCRVSSKNKFEKLVHLVGFIIRIYHDARSPERQMRDLSFLTVLVLKIRFFWKEYTRHQLSGVMEHVSPVFHSLLGLLNHSR